MTPSRFPIELRPFLDDPPPRLVAVRIWTRPVHHRVWSARELGQRLAAGCWLTGQGAVEKGGAEDRGRRQTRERRAGQGAECAEHDGRVIGSWGCKSRTGLGGWVRGWVSTSLVARSGERPKLARPPGARPAGPDQVPAQPTRHSSPVAPKKELCTDPPPSRLASTGRMANTTVRGALVRPLPPCPPRLACSPRPASSPHEADWVLRARRASTAPTRSTSWRKSSGRASTSQIIGVSRHPPACVRPCPTLALRSRCAGPA